MMIWKTPVFLAYDKKELSFLKLKPLKKSLKSCFEDEYCPLKLQSFYPNMPYNLVSGVSVQSRQ